MRAVIENNRTSAILSHHRLECVRRKSSGGLEAKNPARSAQTANDAGIDRKYLNPPHSLSS
jgi:hypothetical protein